MAKTRKFLPSGQVAVQPKHPGTLMGWRALLERTIERASECGDRRLTGLQKALETGKAEATLRAMGVICEADVQREFPELKGND